jgi:hypothetical protein
MRDHPSGRPVRVERDPVPRPWPRRPHDEPLTPRLREPTVKTEAVGFLYSFLREDGYGDD